MSVKSPWVVVSVAFIVLFCTFNALAVDDPDLISLGIGQYDQDLIDLDFLFLNGTNGAEDRALDYRLEYRFGKSLIGWTEPYAKIKPFVGFEGTSKGAGYGLAGILADIPIGPLVEFRSMLELGYKFENDIRLSVGYSHISNANLTELNPGVDIVVAYLHFPVGMLTGNR